jgi:hypothetical protein
VVAAIEEGRVDLLITCRVGDGDGDREGDRNGFVGT